MGSAMSVPSRSVTDVSANDAAMSERQLRAAVASAPTRIAMGAAFAASPRIRAPRSHLVDTNVNGVLSTSDFWRGGFAGHVHPHRRRES